MRSLRRTVLVLVVLAVMLVAADRVAAWAAGEAVAARVDEELANYNVSAADSRADVAGVPFLTQVVSGEYREVTLRLRDVGSTGVRLPELRLIATGVSAPVSALVEDSGQIHADRVDGTAVVGYGTLAAQAGVDGLELSAADGGVAVRLPVELLGVEVTLTGTATIRAADNTIAIRVTELTAEELPPGSASEVERFVQQLSFNFQLPDLPYGLVVESVRPISAGLEVSFSAVDVPLSR
ncbi:MAG TPA: DUF2993 domain-containing protein [Jiangellaceae bacterium]